MSEIDNYVSVTEYSIIWNMDGEAVKKRCQRGTLKSARKIGRNWLIDKTEQPTDKRVTNGKFKKTQKK